MFKTNFFLPKDFNYADDDCEFAQLFRKYRTTPGVRLESKMPGVFTCEILIRAETKTLLEEVATNLKKAAGING